MKPKRIQRKRTSGWKMPRNTVYVGRPSKWGNMFTFKPSWKEWYHLPDCVNAQQAVDRYRESIRVDEIVVIKSELRGENLACWCPLDQPCHADVLLELANT